MSFIPVAEYLAGIFVFGFFKLIINKLVDAFKGVSATGTTYDLANYIWLGITIIYLLGGAFWLWKKYSTPNSGGGLF